MTTSYFVIANNYICEKRIYVKTRSYKKIYTYDREKVNSGQYPSFREIKDFLAESGFNISSRTLQRDIDEIRFEFGVEIKYDRYKNGYFIDKETSINLDNLFRFLEAANISEFISESMKENKNSLNYVDFDTNNQLKGIQYLQPILQAITEHREISFTHYNFYKEEYRKYILKPYLLKEYQNRWYVVGIPGDETSFLIFGIDRIEDLDVSADIFKVNEELNAKEMFQRIIGLSGTRDVAEEVVLMFIPTQGNYIKSLPLHTSQKIISDDDAGLKTSLTVVPNYELKQEILKHGNTVKVEKPQWLADKIIANITEALNQYNRK